MKILIICSKKFYSEIEEVKKILEEKDMTKLKDLVQ